MHRSNSICPISDVRTVVCCVFDNAGFLLELAMLVKVLPVIH